MITRIKLNWFMLASFIIGIILSTIPIGTYSAAQLSDIQGHWAQQAIQEMVDQGAVTGMPDGSFKPDNSISRAEFAAVLVKAFNLDNTSGIIFNDINEHWAKDYIITANACGIVNGYSDTEFGPDDPVTREQMAVMAVKAANLHSSGTALSFSDNAKISSWANDAVEIASENKVISGFPDGSCRPQASATRAQAVVTIINAQKIINDNTPLINPINYDQAGTYGPYSGSATINNDVIISTPEVTLQNMIIEGKLTVAKSVGEGTVILKNIVVNGNTYINGGGTHSIYFIDSQTGKTYVYKDEGPVRIVISGTTEIIELIAQSSVNIQEVDLTGQGLDGIIVSRKTDDGIVVNLTGIIVNNLSVETDQVTIITDSHTTINNFTANAQVAVTGTGTVQSATINASGVTFVTQPTSQTLAAGVDAPTITGTSDDDDSDSSSTSLVAISNITGIAQTGSVLTAGTLTPAGATASYKWQICAAVDGIYSDIAGAIASTYTPVAGDAGKYIRVAATGTGRYSGTVSSAAALIETPAQATPTFNPAAGAVPFGTTVAITSAGADAIYYTTDGSDPTIASTDQAITPLVINAEITVKAIAVKSGLTNSAIASAAYTQAEATAPSAIVLAVGSTNPVGGVTNVAIPEAGEIDTSGAVTDWIPGIQEKITFTVSDATEASSTITINGSDYSSGTDYTIAASAPLTIIVTTTEANRSDCVRTFTISVTAAPAQATPTFSPAAGAVPFGTAVTITSAGADAIYYTTDGSDPTTASTNQATTPLVINAEMTVKAIAVKAGLTNSAIASATYTQAEATAPTSIILAAGSTNPVGEVTNVSVPAAGDTDTTGAVIDWIAGIQEKITFTVSDDGEAASTITINGSDYSSGTDYTIAAAAPLTIIVTTTEANRADCVRTFTISVTAAPAQVTPTFSPAAGAVPFGTDVEIASAGADAIYYTTDGSDPTIASTNQAITPLVINAAITVKAIAVKAGLTNSAIASATYTQAEATAPSAIVLAAGSTNPVGEVTNVSVPAAGDTDTTGAVIDWIAGIQEKITFTVSDDGEAASTITINGSGYTSGTDYTITAASPLTIVVTTTEANRAGCVRTFTISVSAAPAQATPTFSPAAGAVPFGTAVTITSAGADAIYYTTDGSDPTIASTNQAITPLVINAEITVKAKAVKAGLTNSAIASATYTQAEATAPSAIVLAAGSTNPVGGVSNVAIPEAGESDTSGAVTDWIPGIQEKITFTVSDDGEAASTITINGSDYTSGTDYTIAAAATLTIVVTTSEANRAACVRTFTVSVTQAPSSAPNAVVLAAASTTPVGGVTNVAIPAAGDTDTTGAVIDWIAGIQDQITFTVSDAGEASSTITINGSDYTSGTDYTIAAAAPLTIVVTTTEISRAACVRTFIVSVTKSSNTNLAISDGSIISSINNTSKDIALPSFMSEGLKTAGQVLGAVESLDGSIQSYEMLGGDRSSMSDDAYVGGTCYLIVTAADEVTTAEYEVYYS